MRLILYDPLANDPASRLRNIIEDLVSKDELEIYETIAGLSGAVHRPTGEATLAVLFAADRRDLKELVVVKNCSSSLRIIVIVPDCTKETIAAGHRLHPRFLGFAEDGFAEVAAVLERTIRLMTRENKGKRSQGSRPTIG